MRALNKIIEYGLYVLVFLLPWQTRLVLRAGEINGGYWEYGTISLYVTDIVLLLLLLLFIVYKLLRQKTEDSSSALNNKTEFYWLVIAGLELFIFISIFFVPDKILAFYGYIKFLLGVGLFWLVVSARYEKTKLLFSLFFGVVMQAMIGIWQFLSQSSFANKWLGMAMHSAGEPGTSVVEFGTERWLRAYGGFDHPNILGGVLAVSLLLVIILEIGNNFKLGKNKFWNDLSYYFFFIIFSFGLFVSFSRGAWIGFAIGILAIWFFSFIDKKQNYLKSLGKVFGLFVIIFFLASFMYKDLLLTRLSVDTRLENKSNIERVASFKDAGNIIKTDWLFGSGIGNYGLALKESLANDKSSYFYQPAHNVFLLVWSEVGIFGLIFFFMLFGYLFFSRRKTHQESLMIASSLALAVLVMMMVDHWWWSLHFGILFFWLVLGLVFASKENDL